MQICDARNGHTNCFQLALLWSCTATKQTGATKLIELQQIVMLLLLLLLLLLLPPAATCSITLYGNWLHRGICPRVCSLLCKRDFLFGPICVGFCLLSKLLGMISLVFSLNSCPH